MRQVFTTLIMLIFSLRLSAQDSVPQVGRIQGILVTARDKHLLRAAGLLIPLLQMRTVTDDSGRFMFAEVPYGKYILVAGNDPATADTFGLFVQEQYTDAGILTVHQPAPDSFYDAAVTGDPVWMEDNYSNDLLAPGLHTPSKDPYVSGTTINLSPYGFHIRGYPGELSDVYLNGLLMNDAATGAVSMIPWSGLGRIFADNDMVSGLESGATGCGGLAGSSVVTVSPAREQEQTFIAYAHTDRTYPDQVQAAHHTGMMDNGWAFSVAGSFSPYANGYVEGTSSGRYAVYAGISRKLKKRSLIEVMAMVNRSYHGNAIPATQEAMDLAGSPFYNPAWGYQEGRKRNSVMSNIVQPVYLLRYEYAPDPYTLFDCSIAFQHGYSGTSGLDWYQAADPRPDYYKKMPGYYTSDPQHINTTMAEIIRQQWYRDPAMRQVNWEALYEANRINIDEVNGLEGPRSVYTLGEDREDRRQYNLAVRYRRKTEAPVSFSAGFNLMLQRSENYRKMLDLLGGDYYVNLNQFAEQTYAGNTVMKQVDILHPDQIIRVGDRYAYHYRARFIKSFLWGQALCSYPGFDLFAAGRIAFDAFDREGLYQSGLFPDNSLGKQDPLQFITWRAKAGLRYKISGNQYVYLNGAVMTEAPDFDNTFISPKTRNARLERPVTEKIYAAEAGYWLRTSRINGRLSLFVSDLHDASEIRRFYYEGYNAFVNYVMEHINTRNLGGELFLQTKVSPSFRVMATATWMQAFYRSRPRGTLYRDNDTLTEPGHNIAYLQNYYVAAGPQSAYTLGLQYHSLSLLDAGINCNLLDRNYVAVNPMRLTEEAVGLLTPGSPEREAVLRQEKLPSAFTVDIYAGKTCSLGNLLKRLRRKTLFQVRAGISNLLNRKDILIRGYDQMRFDGDTKNPDLFPPKYTYAYGVRYFVRCSLTF